MMLKWQSSGIKFESNWAHIRLAADIISRLSSKKLCQGFEIKISDEEKPRGSYFSKSGSREILKAF